MSIYHNCLFSSLFCAENHCFIHYEKFHHYLTIHFPHPVRPAPKRAESEIRYTYLALISGRQMHLHKCVHFPRRHNKKYRQTEDVPFAGILSFLIGNRIPVSHKDVACLLEKSGAVVDSIVEGLVLAGIHKDCIILVVTCDDDDALRGLVCDRES